MKKLLIFILLFSVKVIAAIDIGVGTSSFSAGRAIPSFALGFEGSDWGLLYRSEGVQTTIYSQNAWTLGVYKKLHSEKVFWGDATIGAGLGSSYILRTFRSSVTSAMDSESDTVVGPHLTIKYEFGRFYIGFDTLLGLTSDVIQHIALNFQDVSHFTIGFSL